MPELVDLVHKKKAKFPKLVDALLVMRKSETVAHGATGSREDLERILDTRIPQLGELLAMTQPLWDRLRVVLPAAAGPIAHVWMGATPASGRFRTMPFAGSDASDQLLLIDEDDSPVLALHPIFVVDEPSPGAHREIFTLDRGSKRGAVYVAFPSMAERTLTDVWNALSELLGNDATDGASDVARGRPFRGLESFDSEHADIFFGRERQAETLANRIRSVGMLTVTGPSGAGKTSLLQAGALPRIRELNLMVMRPGDAPLQRLAGAIATREEGEPGSETNPPDWLDDLVKDASEQHARLITRAAIALTLTRVALVVDQAEELLTLCKDAVERNLFGRLLARLSLGPTRVVIAVREDFFARLGGVDGLRDNYNREVEVVATPDREALARTVTAPLAAYGFALEDTELLVEMVEAVEDEPAALALLQFCADRLWDLRDRKWKRLSWDAYRAIGGVVGALASHGDGVMDGLNAVQQKAARRILLRLVTPERTRAVVPRRTLLEAAADQGDAVLGRLVEERLVAVRESDSEDPEMELVHEALIGHWGTLRGWLNADEEGQRLAHALSRAATQWSERGETRGLLWRGDVLEDLRRWRRRGSPVLTDLEVRFAGASESDELRGRRVRRGLAALAVALTAAAAVVLFVLWRDALAARNRAEVRGLVAQARQREQKGELAEAAALYRAAAQLDDMFETAEIATDLVRLAQEGRFGRELPGHDGPVWRVAVSPNGALLASASVDGTLRIWEAVTGKLVHSMGGHTAIVEALSFLPDGKHILTASGSLTEPRGEMFLWDVSTGKHVVSFQGHTAPVLRVAHADGWVASGSRDKTVRVWRPDGKVLHTLEHPKSVSALAAVGDLVVSTSGSSVYVWDAKTGERVRTLGEHGDGVLRLAVAPKADSPVIIAGATRGLTRVWDLNTGGARMDIPQVSVAVAISADGNIAATGHADGLVRLWQLRSGELSAELNFHSDTVGALAFTADGAQLVSAAGRTAAVWDVEKGALVAVRAGHRDVIHSLALHDQLLVTASADRSVRLFDRAPRVTRLARENDPVTVRHSPDGAHAVYVWQRTARLMRGRDIVADVAVDGAIDAGFIDDRTWIVVEPEQVRAFSLDGALTQTIPDMSTTSVSLGAGRLALLAEGQLVFGDFANRCTTANRVTDERGRVSLSPQGQQVVVSAGRVAKLFDTDCSPGPELAGHEAKVSALGWSSSGKRVVTTSRHTARVWDATTGESLHVFTGHKRTVTSAAVSADDKRLATTSLDTRVRIFDLDTGKTHATLEGHRAPARWVRFSSDGARVVSAGDDGRVLIWTVDNGELLERLSLGNGPVASLSLARYELITGARGGVVGAFDISPLEPAAALSTIALRTNFRVCRAAQRAVAVLPFPTEVDPWAPASACE